MITTVADSLPTHGKHRFNISIQRKVTGQIMNIFSKMLY